MAQLILPLTAPFFKTRRINMKKNNIIANILIIIVATISSLLISFLIIRHYTKNLKTNIFEKDINIFLLDDKKLTKDCITDTAKKQKLNEPKIILV